MLKLNFLVALLMIFAMSAMAQQVKLSGKVLDQSGLGLPGANISVKGTTNGTITDIDGNYTIMTAKGDVLLYSFIGFSTQEIEYTGQNKIDVTLKADNLQLQEVVAVGYGTQKKANLTGAISSMRVDDAVNQPVTNTSQLLQGKMTGVHLTQGGGQPGRDGATINIRGIGTNGNSAPMVVVDGVERELGDISPSDIESISVLKDAASAAIYGSRAANGVVLITTKSGKSGKPKVKYNAYIGWQQATVLPDLMDAVTYAQMINEATGTTRYTDEMIQKIKDGSDPDRFANTDWADQLFRTSPVTNHYLSFSGGKEKTNYVFSINYMDQEGTMLGSESQRYNARLKVDSQVKDWLKIGVNVDGSVKKIEEPIDAMSGNDGLMRRIFFDSPVAPVKYSNGDWAVQDGSPDSYFIRNVVFRSGLGDNVTDQYRFNARAFANFQLMKGLSFETSVAYSHYTGLISTFKPTFILNNLEGEEVLSQTTNNLKNTNAIWNKVLNENVLRYDISLGDHDLKALLGHSIQTYRKDGFNAKINGFPNNEIHELNAGSLDPLVGGSASELVLQSLFGRINYTFKGKYLLEGNLRIDESSRFARGNRTGYFPSFSAGWRVSEESFMEPVQDVISNLKVRASWGMLGNQEIGTLYPNSQTYNLGQDYFFADGENLAGGTAITSLANKDLKWETTETYDVGFDLGINRNLNVSFDYFHKSTKDLLLRLPLPSSLGVTDFPYQNAGEVLNKGWEISAEYHGKVGEVNFQLGGNISQVHNEWVDLKGTESYPSNRIHREGEALFSYFGLKAIGIFQTEEEVAQSATQSANTAPGDIKFADVSGPEGVPDGKIDDSDRVIIGNPIPEFTYGFNGSLDYKGLDFAFLFQGVKNVDRYVGGTNHAGNGDRMNWTSDWENRWTQEKPSNQYPRLGHNKDNEKVSSYYIWDASYLRLKNIELGYTLPQTLTQRAGIEKLRFYISGQNLLTITDFKHWDPEKSIGNIKGESYPLSKTYTVGVNLTF